MPSSPSWIRRMPIIKTDEPEKALAAIARFQRHHPQHPNMDYALYLKGLVLFNEDQSFLNKLASQDWSDRDPKANRDAYQAFAELVQRYPNSKYAADATERMAKLVDALGGNEISVARYYMKRGAYVAAANRAQKIVSRYQKYPLRRRSFGDDGIGIQKTGQAATGCRYTPCFGNQLPAKPVLATRMAI